MRIFALLFFAFIAIAPLRAEPMPHHPRLLATSADFARLRESVAQPGLARDTFAHLLRAGEQEFAAPPLARVVVGRRLLATSRDAVRRILNFSMLHRLTGDAKWAARAEQELLAVSAFTDWNPTHFLDTAEMATAVAIGYDWLYDSLSADTRRTLREALVKHALTPGGESEKTWWLTRGTPNNWLQVCEGGLVLAALAVAEDHPELAERFVERARRHVPAIFETYRPTGAYFEGPMYWGYGTIYHLLLVEALRTATGSSGDLATDPAFLQSARAVNMLTAPSGQVFNFGDCSLKREYSPSFFWFARETRTPAMAAGESVRLRNVLAYQKGLTDRFFALTLLWMHDNAAAAAAPEAHPSSWKTDGPNPIAVFRRGEGPASLYAAIKGGRARISHAHMDAGSFILELGGVRWSIDLGMPNYHELEKRGVHLFGKDRWSVYVLGPHSHSIPLIDDVPPDEEATATLQAFDENRQTASINLSPLYAKQVESLRRDLRIISTDTVAITDTVAGAKPGSRYRFSWMTRASVETDARSITLREKDKALRLEITADAPFEIVNEDASRPPQSYDQPQPGLRRVGVILTVAKPEHTLTVTARLVGQ